MRGVVFKPFVRLDQLGRAQIVKDEDEPGQAGDEVGGSQGFGLIIVKRVAELHDGVAVIKSNDPHGTVFCLAFPFVRNTPDSKAFEK